MCDKRQNNRFINLTTSNRDNSRVCKLQESDYYRTTVIYQSNLLHFSGIKLTASDGRMSENVALICGLRPWQNLQ